MRWLVATLNEQRRRRALARSLPGPLADYLEHPYPSLKTPCHELKFAALDFETTGLVPARDKILSIGLVPFTLRGIMLAESWHQVLQSSSRIPEASAIIHGITDDDSAAGEQLAPALDRLLHGLRGCILVTHHGAIEMGFLSRICLSLYHAPFIAPCLDTEQLAQRYLSRRNIPLREGDLRLFNLRERFGLPRYKAHNALSDALATAELFLAITASITADKHCRLRDFL